ncbi:MAG: zinc ribbon domain-containing protein [Candidatus Baldrarchaeia archaeon]
MEEELQETISCPHCGAAIQKDSVYCPYCGERIKPIEYSSELKGAAVFEEASNIFGKNLSLCIISLLGMIVISVLAFLIIMPSYLSYFESF